VLVPGPPEFVAAVERLAADDAERTRIAAAARSAGRALDWDALARRYETEVLDRHLA
jgi:glycosyltransferase involved in cell wall biosynthesis